MERMSKKSEAVALKWGIQWIVRMPCAMSQQSGARGSHMWRSSPNDGPISQCSGQWGRPWRRATVYTNSLRVLQVKMASLICTAVRLLAWKLRCRKRTRVLLCYFPYKLRTTFVVVCPVRDEISKLAVFRGQSTLQKLRYKCLKSSCLLH